MAFENPTNYVEVDPSSQLSSSGNKFIFTGLIRNVDTYFYKDCGVDFWSGDFEFKFKIQGTSGDDAGRSQHLTLANTIDDFSAISLDAGQNAICGALRKDPGIMRISIYEVDGTSFYVDGFVGVLATDYWVTLKRVGTTLIKFIYADEFITLVDTLSLSLHNLDSFRYLYPVQSANDGNIQALTGYIEDIDLGLGIVILRRRMEGY